MDLQLTGRKELSGKDRQGTRLTRVSGVLRAGVPLCEQYSVLPEVQGGVAGRGAAGGPVTAPGILVPGPGSCRRMACSP